VTKSPLGIIAIVLVAIACCAAPALAQEPAKPAQTQTQTQNSSDGHGFGVQILGGPLFSNYEDVTGVNFDQRIGYLIGIGFGGNRRGVVGVQADVLYGSKPVEIVGKGTLEQSVVHVPVMLKLNFGQESAHGFRVFLLGGGYIEWQFNGKLENVDLAGDTSGFEAGYTVGGGFEVLRLSVQARYARGLRGIDKTFNLSQTVETKSNCFLLLFGIRLN
jgi:hypothetical protein